MKALARCGGGWVVLAAVAAGSVQAATIHVSTAGNDASDGQSWAAAKATVQAGLNAAAPGDEVWVAAGTYIQCILLKEGVALYGGFAGTETDLSQRNWAANVTILDGNQAGSVVTAPAWAIAFTRIDGFTIRRGSGTLGAGYRYGGGIYCDSSSPTIANNTITGNSADRSGGGIYCYSSSPAITNNTIADNYARYGGGIVCYSSSPSITNNIITGNIADDGSGGGIYCYSSSPAITNNTITGNEAAYYSGGGIYCYSSSPAITNNIIANNHASPTGGGIFCDSSSSPPITNNTITGNYAMAGGGICCRSSSPAIANTIIVLNSSGIYNSEGTPTVRQCCIYGNSAYNFEGMPDPTGSEGNISADPRFVSASPGSDGVWAATDDTFADLRLLPGSPCIDAGNNSDVPADAVDLDGDGDTSELLPVDLAGATRFVDDPYKPDTGSGTAPLVDIGAYEHRCGDVDGDGLVDVVDLLGVVYAFGTLQGEAAYDAACDFNADGAVDVIDLLDIVYNFGR